MLSLAAEGGGKDHAWVKSLKGNGELVRKRVAISRSCSFTIDCVYQINGAELDRLGDATAQLHLSRVSPPSAVIYARSGMISQFLSG